MQPNKAARDLAEALATLHRETNALHAMVARQLGLTTPQAELLCQLNNLAPSLGELANMLGCDKTNITGMVDRLAQRGLVRREANAADRRVSRVTLTAEGEALRSKMHTAMAEAVARCGEAMVPAGQAHLADALQALTAALHDARAFDRTAVSP